MSLGNEIAAVEVFPSTARTATATSGGIDSWNLYGRARSMVALLSVGAASGTTPTLDVRFQDSADATTWADLVGGAFAQVSAAGFQELELKGYRQHVRAIATAGGTSPSFTFSLTVIFGDALSEPI